MTATENKILIAQQGRLIKTMKMREVGIIIQAWIPEMCRYAGRKVSDKESKEISNDLATDVYDDFKHYTIEEVKLYLEMGLKREFGEFKWFTGSVAYGWLRAGLQLSSNVKRLSQPRDDTKIDFDDPAMQKDFYDYLIATVKQYKTIPYWNYCPVYHYMIREKLLVLSKEDQEDVKKRVRLAKVSQQNINMLKDSVQFDVLFRAEAVKIYLEKTYQVGRFELKLKKVEGNISRL